MLLEALTVCVNYGDFLAVAAAHNRALFDRWLVVTTPEDEETREVCRQFNLDTLITREGITPGREFNRGYLIERGLQQLSTESWHWHLDADVILPDHTRQALQVAPSGSRGDLRVRPGDGQIVERLGSPARFGVPAPAMARDLRTAFSPRV